jgi:hypothetical protein
MDEEPTFRVVRGAPTDEELAVIVGVLWSSRQAALATLAAVGGAARPHPSRWRASVAPRAGRLPAPGPGAWAHTH